MSQESLSRFAVGIDLGTTHCVLSYVDREQPEPSVQVLMIEQLSGNGQINALPQLASFIYQAHPDEFNAGMLALPWQEDNQRIVGQYARELGAKTPLRLISSAKSWLGHAGVDRHQAFLPLNSPDEVAKLSPLAASEQYLQHCLQAWQHQFPDADLRQQEVTITIPASFDPAARDLTALAAQHCGFEQLTLLEEPQAAMYSWLQLHEQNWREQVALDDVLLVVDIGGGTTDLSLLTVKEDDGQLQLERIAVGEHILLGGDNMDLALAYHLRAKLAQQGQQLQPWQIQALIQPCRDAKERLLNDAELASISIVVPDRSSNLFATTVKTELSQQDVQQVLIEGFLPQCRIDEHPQQAMRSALSQVGLPYAQDAAISKHIAAFLQRQQPNNQNVGQLGGPSAENTATAFIKPNKILFNGGVLKSAAIAQRLLDTINQWLQAADAPAATLLDKADLDLAVARGAAYFSYVRHNEGVRIRGGIANAYYVGVESAMPAIPGMPPEIEALCIAPFGMEEGSQIAVLPDVFHVTLGQPVQFRFFSSNTRRDDPVGLRLNFWQPQELEELAAISATLEVGDQQAGAQVPVRLESSISEIGTLIVELVALDDSQRWQVEFDVRQ